jgi:hypothetical protein
MLALYGDGGEWGVMDTGANHARFRDETHIVPEAYLSQIIQDID